MENWLFRNIKTDILINFRGATVTLKKINQIFKNFHIVPQFDYSILFLFNLNIFVLNILVDLGFN